MPRRQIPDHTCRWQLLPPGAQLFNEFLHGNAIQRRWRPCRRRHFSAAGRVLQGLPGWTTRIAGFHGCSRRLLNNLSVSFGPSPDNEIWGHLPASRHSGSGELSYTDGHAEIHRWRDARTLRPVQGVQQAYVDATGSQDWKYLWDRMTK